MQRFKERLVSRRNKLDLTQEELAEKSKVSARSIANYEVGGSLPSGKTVEKLAQALGVSVAWLHGADTANFEPSRLTEPEPEYAISSIDPETFSDSMLAAMLADLSARIPRTPEPERSKMVQSLMAVNRELKLRGQKADADPPLEGKGLTDDVKRVALDSRDLAGHMARRPASPKYPRSDTAASTSENKGALGPAAPPKTKAASGGQ